MCISKEIVRDIAVEQLKANDLACDEEVIVALEEALEVVLEFLYASAYTKAQEDGRTEVSAEDIEACKHVILGKKGSSSSAKKRKK